MCLQLILLPRQTLITRSCKRQKRNESQMPFLISMPFLIRKQKVTRHVLGPGHNAYQGATLARLRKWPSEKGRVSNWQWGPLLS